MSGLSALRIAILGLAGLEILAGIGIMGIFYKGATDPLGRNIAYGVMILTCIPRAICVLPALALGFLDRWLPFALLLALAAAPAWLLMRGA